MEKNEEYYLGLDKRSKEYKDWKKQQPVEGLGDGIEKVTEATGIKKAIIRLTKESILNQRHYAYFLIICIYYD